MIGTEDSGIENGQFINFIHQQKWKQKRKLWSAARCVAATW